MVPGNDPLSEVDESSDQSESIRSSLNDECTEKNNRLSGNITSSRRSLLGALGVGTGLLTGIPFVSAEEETVKIDVRKTGDGYIYREVPKDWKDHLDRSREILRKYKDNNLAKSNVVTIGLASKDVVEYGNNLRGFKISVGVSDLKRTNELPSDSIGLPVEFHEEEPEDDSWACTNDIEPDPVVGGIPIGEDGDGVDGTMGGLVEHNGNPAGLTAKHIVVDDICSDDPQGNDIDQKSRDFGKVTVVKTDLDAVIIEKTNNSFDTAYKIKEENGDEIPNGAIWAKNGVSFLDSSNNEVRHTGVSSGTLTGNVDEHEISTSKNCVSYNNEGVRTSIDGEEGDSGSFVYTIDDNGYTGPVHLHTQGNGDQSGNSCVGKIRYEIMGTAMYEIDNQISSIDWHPNE